MSKVIMKQKFKHPNLKSTSQSNVGHVNYIGTRAGVDKSLGSDTNIIKGDFDYSEENSLDKELSLESSEFVYAKYIHERPNSHGLFGQYGVENINEIQKEIGNNKSFVWRTIVSLKEDDATNLGYTDKSKWQDMLRSKMPDIAKMMNIPYSNLKWVGAVHMEEGHPHVHVMYWEKQSRLKHGVVSVDKLNGIRKILTDEIFKDEREVLLLEKNELRSMFVNESEEDLSLLLRNTNDNEEWISKRNLGIEENIMTSKVYFDTEEKIRNLLENLSDKLPTEGRKAYGYMPENVKIEINELVDLICELPEYENILARNEIVVRQLTEMYTSNEEDIQKAIDNSTKDLKKRFSQIVLKGAFSFRDFGKYDLNFIKLNNSVNGFKNFASSFNEAFENDKIALAVIERCSQIGVDIDDIREKLINQDIDISNLEEEDVLEAINNGQKKMTHLNSKRLIIEQVSLLKSLDFQESEVYSYFYKTIASENDKIVDQVDKEHYDGDVTQEGLEEVMKVISYSESDLSIINKLIFEESLENKNVSLDELLKDEDIYNGVMKSQTPFKFITIDKRVVKAFKEGGTETKNKITLSEEQLTNYILDDLKDEYAIEDLITEEDNLLLEDFDNNYKFISNRINTLKLNQFITQDRESGTYTITNNVIESIENINTEFEFGKYDATVTLDYFENNSLEYKNMNKLFDNIEPIKFSDFDRSSISINDGKISPSHVGWGLINLNKDLNKNIYESIKNIPKNLHQFVDVKNNKCVLNQLGKNTMKVFDFGKTMENLIISKDDNLLTVMNNNGKEFAIEKKLNSLKWRLKMLVKIKVLEKNDVGYTITKEGLEKRKDILEPKRVFLRERVKFLMSIGHVDYINDHQIISNVNSNELLKLTEQKRDFEAKGIGEISSQIYRNNGKFDLKLNKEKKDYAITKSFYDKDYEQAEKVHLRETVGIIDYQAKSIVNASLMMLNNGMDSTSIKDFFEEWNKNHNNELEQDKINIHVDKALISYNDTVKWGTDPYISEEDYKEMFKLFNVDPSNVPDYYNEWNKDTGKSFNVNALMKILESEAKKEESNTRQMVDTFDKRIKQKAKTLTKEGRLLEAKKKKSNTIEFDDR